MKERGLTYQQVRGVVYAPHTDAPSTGHPGRRVLTRRLRDGRTVGVVVALEAGDDVVVVTAWVSG